MWSGARGGAGGEHSSGGGDRLELYQPDCKRRRLGRNQPAVSVISMSFGGSEFTSETDIDDYFTTPAGHQGITFLASTGDTPTGGYPAMSPNVVGVGGTFLTVDSNNNYVGESGWSSGGGGISFVENKPAYQQGVVTQSSTKRTVPDVAMVADPNSGVAVYDSYDYPGSSWVQVGGTSLACPLWAGVIAIADQGRATVSLQTLDGPSATLPMLYNLPASDFHDITTGSNGNAAGPGYDLVTGLGSPIVDKIAYGFMGTASISGTVFQDNNSDGIKGSGEPAIAGATVYLDSNSNGVFDTGTITHVSMTTPASIPDRSTLSLQSTLAVSGTSSTISNVSVTLNITHSRDSDLIAYLMSPSGRQVELFGNVGARGRTLQIPLSATRRRQVSRVALPHSMERIATRRVSSRTLMGHPQTARGSSRSLTVFAVTPGHCNRGR